MSAKHFRHAWDSGLPPAERVVLMFLADLANDRGESSPTMAQIADETGMVRRSVQRVLHCLEAGAWLRREAVSGDVTTFYLMAPKGRAEART